MSELFTDLFSVELICPECRSEMTFEAAVTQPMPAGLFGVLSCVCGSYPVLDSIPVLRSGRVDVQDHNTGRAEIVGPRVEELVELVRADRGLDALVELLAFPPAIPFSLADRPGLRLPFTRGPLPRVARAARRGEVSAMLDELDELTAQDWMELCYKRSSGIYGDMLPYFFARFGQPRHLSSLSFLQALPDDHRPVLDLACGFGHIMYNLAARQAPRRSVGVDRNFFQLWVARRYIAPGQSFVCSDRVDALPFGDDVFSASVCTDAFHLFPSSVQQACMDELRRVAARDTVLLDRVGNRLLAPRDTDVERDPQGYVDLLRDAPYRLACEDDLFAGYRRGVGPDLARHRKPSEFDEHKWLSLISSADPALFRDYGRFSRWPHAEGDLRINSIYQVERDADGDVRLVFVFPTTWYAFENGLMTSYTSAGETLDPATFDALAAGYPVEDTDFFVRRFVVLAIPTRYQRTPGTLQWASLVGGLTRGARYLVRHRSVGSPSRRSHRPRLAGSRR